MFINNTYINLPNEEMDISKFPNYIEENEFISNLMSNPQKYREFKTNINRINNIENEKNYLKSLERKNEINFLDNIMISEEEYQKSLKDEELIFENLNEDRINDLLSHKKLLSYEKHLIETMSYFLGYESFDWNLFRKILNLYDLKTKMKNIDYSRLKKRRINVLLGQLCKSEKFNQFLNMNDFCDSGLELVYEWVKTQLKIYFYLYQNKKIPKINISKSIMNFPNYDGYNKYEEVNNDVNCNNINTQDIPEEENDNETINSNMHYNKDNTNLQILNKNAILNNSQQKQEIMDSYIFKNSTNIETNNNNNNSSNISYNNMVNNKSSVINNNNNLIYKSNSLSNLKYNNNNEKVINKNKSTLLLTSLPYLINDRPRIQTNEQSTGSYRKLVTNINLSKKARYLKEAKKVSFKLKGFNKDKEKLLKEIKTAEMLPLLKNRTFPQLRNYFDDKVPFSKKVEERMRNDINYFSLNGTQNEKKMISLIASGKMKAFNLESLFKLRNMLKS